MALRRDWWHQSDAALMHASISDELGAWPKSKIPKPYFTTVDKRQLRMAHMLPVLARKIKFNFKSMVEQLERAEDAITIDYLRIIS